MFNRILVPLDGSTRAEYALPVAARLARASNGTLVLLDVITAAINTAPFAQEPVITHEILDMASTRAIEYLAKIAHSKELHGIETQVAIYSGPVVPTILETAEKQQADLIVLATHGDTGFKRWMVGSAAQHVARQSLVPVLVLRDGGTSPINSYPDIFRPLHTVSAVVALDGSEMAEEAIAPAAQLVSALADPAPGLLHLVQVAQLPDFDNTRNQIKRNTQEQAIQEAEDYLRAVASDMQEQLEKKFHLSITWSVLVETSIPRALIASAEQGKATRGTRNFGGYDILTLATHGRSGLPRLALGSVTEQILGTTKLPLLIVRPRQR